VFPKLGISTRAALRDALTERERATASAAPHDDAAYGVS